MSQTESYDDPVLAGRTRAWMRTTAPVAAPERLVFSVMDEVDRTPRDRGFRLAGRPFLTGLARYAALTLVIAVGVAAGIILSRSVSNVGPATSPTPSLRGLGDIPTDGRLMARGRNGVWLATNRGELLLISTETGALGSPAPIGLVPTDLIARTNAGTPDGETLWLVAPGEDLRQADPTVGELNTVPGAAGRRISIGSGGVWVGGTGEVIKVDLGAQGVLARYEIPEHRPTDPLLIVGNELWVADPTGIERLDTATGDHAGRIPQPATFLVPAGNLVWAADGPRLHGVDPTSRKTVLEAGLPNDLPDITAVATLGDNLFVATLAGPKGAGLAQVDASTGRLISLIRLAAPVTSIAVVGNEVWTLDTSGLVRRFALGT